MGSASILFLAPLVVLSAVGFLRWMRARGIVASVAAAGGRVGACSFAIVATGRLEPHYLTVVIPPLALLAISAGRAAMKDPGAGRVAATVLVAMAVLVAVPAAMAFAARSSDYTNEPQVRAVATWLRSRTIEPATLFVWGDQPELYYLSGLLPATPFQYVLPLVTPGYGGDELSRTVAQELSADLPRWVVDAGSERPGEPGSVPLLVSRPVTGDGRSLDTIDPIRELSAITTALRSKSPGGWSTSGSRDSLAMTPGDLKSAPGRMRVAGRSCGRCRPSSRSSGVDAGTGGPFSLVHLPTKVAVRIGSVYSGLQPE